MATFLSQLVGFALIAWIVTKYALPPVRRLMAAQRETVQHQLDASAQAAQRLAAADSFHTARIEEARIEAQQIVEEARVDAVHIGEQLRAQSVLDAERIKTRGGEQVSLARSQLIRQLRGDLGGESVRRATDLVRAHVADPQAQSATVDRFLDELEAMSSAAFAVDVTSSDLRSASRDARAALVARFESVAAPMSGEQLTALSEELTAVVKLLMAEPSLARHLAEATGEAEAKKQMLARLLGGKVGVTTLELLDTVAAVRWSTTPDSIDAVEHVARLALLVRAEREGQADEVAEQLFRFDRVLEGQPELNTLLSDHARAAGDRVSLLRDVLSRAGGTNPVAEALLAQTVELTRGERADEAVAELALLAVSHRGEIVADVGAAAELSDAQRTRLTQILTRIYHHPVSVQLNVDPALLGGLSVAVGDEVIDGTLSSRLTAAATKLPD
jgi:ATP synthase F0 subunit b/ATP synthase F1 delta subunit